MTRVGNTKESTMALGERVPLLLVPVMSIVRAVPRNSEIGTNTEPSDCFPAVSQPTKRVFLAGDNLPVQTFFTTENHMCFFSQAWLTWMDEALERAASNYKDLSEIDLVWTHYGSLGYRYYEAAGRSPESPPGQIRKGCRSAS